MTESFAELFEQSLKHGQPMQPGSLIRAIVTQVKDDMIIVDAGLKSEGVIPASEFKNKEGIVTVQVGDEVEVAVDALDDGFGESKLSKEKAQRIRSWEALQQAFESGQIVTGLLTGKVKGGFTVDVDGVQAFLPGSLVDLRPVRDATYLEGKVLEMKVIKIDKIRNNIVVSRREVLEAEYSAEREQLVNVLQEGAVLTGVVKNLVEYGAFVDLGGIDGLLHITDMAWKRVKDPAEVVHVGQELDVKVLKFDRERMRVSLGLKQLGTDPWLDVEQRCPAGTRLSGKVTNITDYGCFVEIETGVEGLVHVSEMDWTNKNINPNKLVQPGQEVNVMILDIDGERRRISLGLKQCIPNPWDEFAANFHKGDRVTGQIKSITDFGLFIGLDGGIDGLVHLSDLSWTDAEGQNALKAYTKGQTVDAVVLSIEPDRERISLGIKQVAQDPLASYATDNIKGTNVTGVVTEVDARGANVDLGNGVIGHIRVSELAYDRVEDARTVLNVGDSLEARIIGVDRKTRTISLSVKATAVTPDEANAAAVADANSRNVATGTTNLGDLLKAQMGS